MKKKELLRKKTQHKLIKKFMEDFYEKMGYYPTVITKDNTIENRDGLKILSLEELETYFEPYLPKLYGKTLSLHHKSRIRHLTELRFIFFFLARCMKYNLKDIGLYLGKRDHTTIIHGITTFRNRFETDDMFRELYYKIVNNIKGKDESSAMDNPIEMEFES